MKNVVNPSRSHCLGLCVAAGLIVAASAPSSSAAVIAFYGFNDTLANTAAPTPNLTVTAITMPDIVFASSGPPEGTKSAAILSPNAGDSPTPGVADIEGTWMLTPAAGYAIQLDATNSVTWFARAYAANFTITTNSFSRVFISDTSDFSNILAQSSVFTATDSTGDNLPGPTVSAALNATIISTGPLYFGVAMTDDAQNSSTRHGRIDAMTVNGTVSAIIPAPSAMPAGLALFALAAIRRRRH